MKSVPSQEIAPFGGLERTVSAGASVAVERQREGITQGYGSSSIPSTGSNPAPRGADRSCRNNVLIGPVVRSGMAST